ncbi:antifreeze protein [Mycena leptocephala]|nr:antifreeze protein [Mycena leptocephala]
MFSLIFHLLFMVINLLHRRHTRACCINLGTAANYGILAQSGVSTVPLHWEDVCAEYAMPTPSTLTTAARDMGTAFTDTTGRVNLDFADLGSGAIGGLTLLPGLYKWTTGVTVDSAETISGAATDTWIFQVIGMFTVAMNIKMVLSSAVVAKNIVWVVTGAISVNAGRHLEGILLGKTSIASLTGETANSQLLAQTAVTLQKATVNN